MRAGDAEVHVRVGDVVEFSFFGGVPGQRVPDDLKAGVSKAYGSEPKVNRTDADLAAHYDTALATVLGPATRSKPAACERSRSTGCPIRPSIPFSATTCIATACWYCLMISGCAVSPYARFLCVRKQT
jgi:hypothetical protein